MDTLDADHERIYCQRWQLALSHCQESLERDDLRQVKEAESPQAIYNEIKSLQSAIVDTVALQELVMLPLTIGHLESIVTTFESCLHSQVSASILWGMLTLAIRISSRTNAATHRVARMLKAIGYKAQLFNGYNVTRLNVSHLKEAVLEIHIEMLAFLVELINFFRSRVFEEDDELSWCPVIDIHHVCMRHTDDILDRVERLVKLAKSESQIDEITRLQKLLSPTPQGFLEHAKLPCNLLPIVRNTHVYDREEIISQIDHRFHHSDYDDEKPRAMTLYGLGGVGKSQVALKYAQKRVRERNIDAVVWVYSSTAAAIAQSFTDVALRLGLPNVNMQYHEQNRLVLLNWFQQTRVQWLLVFDNAEDADLLLKYWPSASNGLVLITSRNHNLAFEPAGAGLEVPHFDVETGKHFILHLLSMDADNDDSRQESVSAMTMSKQLNGHALAISQMAGLIHKRAWSIEEFLQIYNTNAKTIEQRTSLDTIWRLSFQSLDTTASYLLGALSLLMPDSIPQKLFQPSEPKQLPDCFGFCRDAFSFSEVIESLLTLALIRRDRMTGTISIHRLVQSQFRFSMPVTMYQRIFESISQLLNAAFPDKPKHSHQMHFISVRQGCQLYLQHVLSLMQIYRSGLESPTALKPSQDFCQLLIRCARYLCENGMYRELEQMLKISEIAVEAWGKGSDYPEMMRELAFHNSVQWQQRGNFTLADYYADEAIRIHESTGSNVPCIIPDPYVTQVLYNHKCGCLGCLFKHEEAYNLGTRIERLQQEHGMKPTSLTKMNFGRCCWKVGKTNEAIERYKWAIKECESGSGNWSNLGGACHGLGNILRSMHRLDEAEAYFSKGKNVLVANGSPTHEWVGICTYKLGLVALERDYIGNAIDYLRDAYTITKLNSKYLPSHYARVLHKLSQALQMLPECHLEADEKAWEAKQLYWTLTGDFERKSLPAGDEAYDALITIYWR